MNGAGIILVFGIFISAIIIVITLIVLLVKSVKKPKLRIVALVILALYILSIYLIVVLPEKRFEKIETSNPICDEVSNEITVLNFGTGSMGSFSVLLFSNDNTVKVSREPHYQHYMNEKFGYTFSPVKEGDVYALVTEIDCADISYADVYHMYVDENNVLSVREYEHIKIREIGKENFASYVADNYNFQKEIIEEEFEYYLSKP